MPAMPHGWTNAPQQPSPVVHPATRQVGLALSFTGHYACVQVIARFLQLAGVEVITSRQTTPAIIASGTTLANSDFCLPLRVYVGHVAHLIADHPHLDYIVAPNVRSEDGRSSACAKHRDIGGVALRSLGDTVGYLLQQLGPQAARERARLQQLVQNEALLQRWQTMPKMPQIIMPSVRSLDWLEMRNLCYNIYADIMRWPRWYKTAFFLPRSLWPQGAARLDRLHRAFNQAHRETLLQRGTGLSKLLSPTHRPRLAVVGRSYMVHDPALTCDLKTWFTRHGAAVITPADVPLHELNRDRVAGFYDSHKEGQAFIDWALPKVDGFICLGSFGCHPDAFQIDYLAEYARRHGAACWTFRFDETTGSTGFHTRFETILTFLEQRRDQRMGSGCEAVGAATAEVVQPEIGVTAAETEPAADVPTAAGLAVTEARWPLIIWPYMGEILNLVLAEMCHQLGVNMHPPAALTGQAMLAGNDRYCESCSPFACSTGSIKSTLTQLLADKSETSPLRRPRRIILIMLRGEGPCTFGWYSIAQNAHIPAEFDKELRAGGHTLEMATMGMSAFSEFIKQLQGDQTPRNRSRLRPLLDFAAAWESGWDKTAWPRRIYLYIRFFRALQLLARPVFAKLAAAEALRAESMLLRAHELTPGSIARALQAAYVNLDQAHTRRAIAAAKREGQKLLRGVPRDHLIKPRIICVGEIYVSLTSFANRGTLETLLAREGVEVVEHVAIGRYIRGSLREMRRRAMAGVLSPLRRWLRRRNIYLLEERLREPESIPFLLHEVGGEGVPSVAGARRGVERGCDGILHVHPFKCMPEGISKDALKEIAALYGVGYLALSFDKEMEIERLRTEISTYSTLLHARTAAREREGPLGQRSQMRRRAEVGRLVDRLYWKYRRHRHCN